jgi:serine/threonine-protein kinase
LAEPILQPGQQVEGYLIEKQIGRGGMAELFLARDLLLKKKVVIKVLGSRFSKEKNTKSQFLREARIQANLDNPHIVQILRLFYIQHNLCLVMQYVKGTDLARVIRRAKSRKQRRGEKGVLSVERAVHIFLQVLEGIGFAHKYRIIHRDIKPSNILLDKQGRAKISDFGLSFLLPHPSGDKEDILQAGTPYYMSPEQILDNKADLRSDIYSLGVTFFNMLTGELPSGHKKKIIELVEFHVEGSLDRARSVLDDIEEIPRGIKGAILKALENEPDSRHQSCLEFFLAIKEEAPHEMYSEILRLCLLSKSDISLRERVYLDRIAKRKGLAPQEAKALEINIRKEMRLPPLDFSREYRKSFMGLLTGGEGKEDSYLDEMERTYVIMDRVSAIEAKMLREEVKARQRE